MRVLTACVALLVAAVVWLGLVVHDQAQRLSTVEARPSPAGAPVSDSGTVRQLVTDLANLRAELRAWERQPAAPAAPAVDALCQRLILAGVLHPTDCINL